MLSRLYAAIATCCEALAASLPKIDSAPTELTGSGGTGSGGTGSGGTGVEQITPGPQPNSVALANACRFLGDLLQSMGRFSEAMNWHTRSMQPQIDPAEFYGALGRLYAVEQQWDRAIATFQKALPLSTEPAALYWSLANLYAETGQLAQEVASRKQAMELDRRWASPGNQLDLGNRLLVDAPDEAIAYYQEALKQRPDFFHASYNLGISLMQHEEVDEAEAALQRTIAIQPDYTPPYFALGRIAQHRNHLYQALNYYRQAIERDPDYAAALCAVGELCLRLHEWEPAVVACRRAVAAGADLPWLCHNLGYALLKQGEWVEAEAWLRRAIAAAPQTSWFHAHLGEVLWRRSQLTAARQELLMALHLQPNLTSAYRPLGCVIRELLRGSSHSPELGSTGESDQESMDEWFSELPPELQALPPDFYANLATHLSSQRQYEAAVWCTRLAQATDPFEMDWHTQLQQIQADQERFNQTVADYYWGIERSPHETWRYTQLGNLLADQGETAAAIALHRTTLKLSGWQGDRLEDYRFSLDWFTHNIPIWTEVLEPLAHQPGLRALEVGSMEGMATCWLLDHILTQPDSRIDCIDLFFQDNFDFNTALASAIAIPSEPPTGTPPTQRVIRWVGDSHTLLPTLEPAVYDLIYLSGAPDAEHLQADAHLSWSLLKPGGLLIFDYYGWIDQGNPGRESRVGIDAFLQTVQSSVEVVHSGYQVVVQKRLAVPLQSADQSLDPQGTIQLQLI